MSEKSEALRLADALMTLFPSREDGERAAAELRRLHELVLEQQGKIYALEMARSMEQKTAKLKQYALRAELKEATEAINDPAVNNLRTLPESIRVLCAQRDALLEALKELMEYAGIIEERCDTVATNKARAVIKAVEEGE